VEVKKPSFAVILTIILVALFLLGFSDSAVSVDNTDILSTEVVSSASKAGNCSASATITITLTKVLEE
jgi:hypothetical protein